MVNNVNEEEAILIFMSLPKKCLVADCEDLSAFLMLFQSYQMKEVSMSRKFLRIFLWAPP